MMKIIKVEKLRIVARESLGIVHNTLVWYEFKDCKNLLHKLRTEKVTG